MRPRKEFNIDAVRKLVRIQCTAEECADWFEFSADTLDRRLKEEGYDGFADFYKKHSSSGRSSLRRAQWKAATKDRNPTMLIWCGKQYLGQQDTHHVDHGGTIDADVTFSPKELARRFAFVMASAAEQARLEANTLELPAIKENDPDG
jgi:hypothetical protein